MIGVTNKSTWQLQLLMKVNNSSQNALKLTQLLWCTLNCQGLLDNMKSKNGVSRIWHNWLLTTNIYGCFRFHLEHCLSHGMRLAPYVLLGTTSIMHVRVYHMGNSKERWMRYQRKLQILQVALNFETGFKMEDLNPRGRNTASMRARIIRKDNR